MANNVCLTFSVGDMIPRFTVRSLFLIGRLYFSGELYGKLGSLTPNFPSNQFLVDG